jgi:hypothetical protein
LTDLETTEHFIDPDLT